MNNNNTSCNISNTWLSVFDLFSLKPSYRITFKNKDVYSTCSGQIMTLILFILCVGTFIYFGLNMFLREQPGTIISAQYENFPEYMNITKDNFFLAFGLQDNQSSFTIDETIYTAAMSIIIKNKTNILKKTPVSVGPCSENDLPMNEEMNEYFIENPILGMYCILDYFPVEMEGSEDSSYYEYIDLTINVCDNATSAVICKTQNEISIFFSSHRFYATFTPYSVNTLNYDEPLNQHGAFFALPMDANTKALTTMTFEHIHIYSDVGVIFESNKLQKGINYFGDQSFFLKKESDTLLDVQMNLGKVVITYQRNYEKLQSVLATTGGAIKILLIFFAIITRPVVNFNFFRDLGNEYFDFDTVSDDGKHKRQELHFNIFQYIFSIFTKKDSSVMKKRKFFNESKRILNNSLSLSQILNKIVEIEKLKFLLFDPTQLALFDYIPKPVISENKDGVMDIIDGPNNQSSAIFRKFAAIKQWNETFFENSLSPRKKNLYSSFKKLMHKKNKSEIDERIIKLTNFGDFLNHSEKEKDKLKGSEKKIIIDDEEDNKMEEEEEKNKEIKTKKILTKSFYDFKDELRQPKPLNIFINTDLILKDLETLKTPKKKINI